MPSSGIFCSLPRLPNDDERRFHTVESSGLLCGGRFSDFEDRCLQWNAVTGTWEDLLTLDVKRYHHVSWTPDTDIGTYLIGGLPSPSTFQNRRTTTLIKPDGTQQPGFQLEYDAV